MNAIHKYPLVASSYQEIVMPAGAQILTVQIQRGKPCMWALVDLELPLIRRSIVMIGTGHSFDGDPGRYINTFQMENGALVLHVFERDSAEK